jgi:hypothetical protein
MDYVTYLLICKQLDNSNPKAQALSGNNKHKYLHKRYGSGDCKFPNVP